MSFVLLRKEIKRQALTRQQGVLGKPYAGFYYFDHANKIQEANITPIA